MSKMQIVLLLPLTLALAARTVAGAKDKWDYDSSSYGQEAWVNTWPVCNGTRQSPIDIITADTQYDMSLGEIEFSNYGMPTGVTFTSKNNGHTLGVSFTGFAANNQPTIRHGGLPGTFKLIGYHFHWGNDSTKGSEHVIDGQSYPAELHLVHQNTKYEALGDAVSNPDGLAVLGVFLKQGGHNSVYENFLNMTKYNVTYPDTEKNVPSFNLMSLLPMNKTFYRYDGSLTTPRCQEAVTWTVFTHVQELSEQQLNEFRMMKYVDFNNETKALVDTFRKPQPLHRRQVLKNFMTPQPSPTKTSEASPTSTVGASPTTPTVTPTTTSRCSKMSEKSLLFFASVSLVVLSYVQI